VSAVRGCIDSSVGQHSSARLGNLLIKSEDVACKANLPNNVFIETVILLKDIVYLLARSLNLRWEKQFVVTSACLTTAGRLKGREASNRSG
jgi:hypothetical protein